MMKNSTFLLISWLILSAAISEAFDIRLVRRSQFLEKVRSVAGIQILSKFMSPSFIELESPPPADISGDIEIPLRNDNVGYGIVGIGTPAQYSKVIFDTGSSDFWVRSTLCNSMACQDKPDPALPFANTVDPSIIETVAVNTHAFNLRESSTFRFSRTAPDGTEPLYSISYGTGTVQMALGTDVLTIPGVNGQPDIKVTGEDFGVTYMETYFPFGTLGSDGIFGLGFPSIALKDTVPPLFNMKKAGLIRNALFSYYVDPAINLTFSDPSVSIGNLRLGSYDSSRSISWVKVVKPTYWVVELEKVTIGDENILPAPIVVDSTSFPNAYPAVFDTGTTAILLPKAMGKKFAKKIGGWRIPYFGLIVCKCDKLKNAPDLTFSLRAEQQFNATSSTAEFSLKSHQYGGDPLIFGYCLTSVIGKDMKNGRDPNSLVIIGEGFLKFFYSVWDVENLRIGLSYL